MPGQVTVACKYPNGLVLRLGDWHDVDVPVMGGGVKTEHQWRASGKQVTINGPRRRGPVDDPMSPLSDGFALTHNVDADFMAKWFEDNKDHDLVRNGLLVYAAKQEDIKSKTRNSRDTRTGMEPLDMSGDRRVPKAIVKDDRKAA